MCDISREGGVRVKQYPNFEVNTVYLKIRVLNSTLMKRNPLIDHQIIVQVQQLARSIIAIPK